MLGHSLIRKSRVARLHSHHVTIATWACSQSEVQKKIAVNIAAHANTEMMGKGMISRMAHRPIDLSFR